MDSWFSYHRNDVKWWEHGVVGASYHCRLQGVKSFETHQHGFVLEMAWLFPLSQILALPLRYHNE